MKKSMPLLFLLLLVMLPITHLLAQTDAFYYEMYSPQRASHYSIMGKYEFAEMEIEEIVPLCDGGITFVTFAMLYVVLKKKGEGK